MTHRMERMTNNRKGEEWYLCEICAGQYPRSKVIVQRGHIRCTIRCVDAPSRHALADGYPQRTEESPDTLPVMVENE